MKDSVTDSPCKGSCYRGSILFQRDAGLQNHIFERSSFDNTITLFVILYVIHMHGRIRIAQ